MTILNTVIITMITAVATTIKISNISCTIVTISMGTITLSLNYYP